MGDTYARVMRVTDGPGDRRTTRSRAPRRSGALLDLSLPGETIPPDPPGGETTRPDPGQAEPAVMAASPAEATFAAAVAAFTAGRDAQRRRGLIFEDVPAPRRLAPYATAIAATVQRDDNDLASGRLVLLYDPDGQQGWDGFFRLV